MSVYIHGDGCDVVCRSIGSYHRIPSCNEIHAICVDTTLPQKADAMYVLVIPVGSGSGSEKIGNVAIKG